MGALSVVICAILSSFFLNEKLTFFGWLGCGLCIVSVLVMLFWLGTPPAKRRFYTDWFGHHRFERSVSPRVHPSLMPGSDAAISCTGPQEAAIGQITEFQKLFLAPGFLVYGSILIAASLVIIFFVAPKSVSCDS